MKRILSYIYPITKKIHSKYSGILELTWYNGKQVLNTKNANYSYGSLQKILAYSLGKIKLTEVKSILLLGLGAGSVIKTLRDDFDYKNTITAIEWDEVIIQIAQETYNITNDSQLKIIAADAISFVAESKQYYDLIIIDLFIDNKVPEQFYAKEFITNCSKLIAKKGYFIFNIGMEMPTDSIAQIQNYFTKNYTFQVLEQVAGTNTVLIGKKLA